MAADVTSLTAEVKSTGLAELAKDGNAAADAMDKVSASADGMSASTDKTSEATKRGSESLESYLNKLKIRTDLLGRNTEFTAQYMSSLLGANEAQIKEAAQIGSSADKFKAYSAAQAEAIKMNKAFDASVVASEAELQRMGKLQTEAIAMNERIDASKLKSSAINQAEIQRLGKMQTEALEMNKKFDEETGDTMGKLGLGTARAKREIVVIGHEMMTGQFSRIPGSLTVLSESLITAGISLTSLIAPFLLFGGILGGTAGIIYLANRGSEDFKELGNSIALTGNFAGKSATEIHELSNSIGAMPVALHDTEKAMQQLILTGKIHSNQLESVGRAAVQMARAHNISVQDAAKELTKFVGDSKKFVEEYDNVWHVLTESQYKQVLAYQKAGDEAKAYEVELAAVQKRSREVADAAEADTGYMAKSWTFVKNIVSGLGNAIADFGAKTKEAAHHAELEASIKTMTSLLGNQKIAIVGIGEACRVISVIELDAAKKELAALDAKTDASAKAAQADHDAQERKLQLGKLIAFTQETTHDKTIKMNNELIALSAKYSAAMDDSNIKTKGNLEEKLQAEKDFEADVLAIRKRYEEPQSKAAETDRYGAELKRINEQVTAAKIEYQGIVATNTGMEKAGLISKATLISVNGQAEIEMYKRTAKAYQDMEDVKTSKKYTASQKEGIEEKRLAELEKVQVVENQMRAADLEADAAMQNKSLQLREQIDKAKGLSGISEIEKVALARKVDEAKVDSEMELAMDKMQGRFGPLTIAEHAFYKKMYEDGVDLKKLWSDFSTVTAQKSLEDYQKKVDKITSSLKTSNPALAAMGDRRMIQDTLNAQIKDIMGEAKREEDLEADKLAIIMALRKKAAEDTEEINTKMQLTQLNDAQTLATGLVSIAENTAGKKSAVARAAFAIEKGFDIAQAMMKLGVAQAAALVAPTFPQALAQEAIVITQAAQIVGDIKSVSGYASGGYTGDGDVSEIAGIVHGQEYVVNAAATSRNRETLEAMNSGAVIGPTSSSNKSSKNSDNTPNVTVHNHGAVIEVEKRSDGEIAIIARREAKATVHSEAPDIIARHISNSNSSVSKALGRSTQTERRR